MRSVQLYDLGEEILIAAVPKVPLWKYHNNRVKIMVTNSTHTRGRPSLQVWIVSTDVEPGLGQQSNCGWWVPT